MQSTTSFNKKYFKKLPLRLTVLLALFAATLFLFVFIIHEVLWEKEEAVDNSIFSFLSANVISNRLTGFMKAVTYFASATFLQIAYGALVILYLLQKNWKRAVEIAVIGIGGFAVNYFMKLSFHRLRPPDPLIERLQNFSFPSGHATSAFIFYGLLTYLVWKTNIPKLYKYIAGSILILFSILIGFSRVYLRVHYPSDVPAGFCIGFAWLILIVWLFEGLKKKTDKEMRSKAH
ncbi:MAG: phosphatase PAP2 family protein [Ferruginibacter sp.]